jgi:hypothetical protein
MSGHAGRRAVGIDVLHGFEQQLMVRSEGTDLIIEGVLVRDYPIIIRLTDEDP